MVPKSSVVVPGVAAPSSVACIRSLGRRGINVIVASENERAAAFASKYCGERVLAPLPGSVHEYRDALLSLAERPDVRTIVPVREEDVFVLSRYADEFAPHVDLPIPSFETLQWVQDRVKLFAAAEAAGVAVPETRPLDEWDQWDRRVIVKSRYNILGDPYLPALKDHIRSGRATTQYIEQGETPDLDEFVRLMEHVPIVQEYVPNTDEYGFFALYDRGEAVATFQHRQRRAYKYYGGPSSFRESIDDPDLDAAGRRLLDHLDWHGLAMVEFLRDDATGEFKLMEVNPRFWSSLPFTVSAGVDFPYYYWLLSQGEPVPDAQPYEVGVAGHLLRGELLYLHSVMFGADCAVSRPSRVGALASVATSLLQHPRFDYLDLDDPWPFLRDLTNLGPSEWTDRLFPKTRRAVKRFPAGSVTGNGAAPADGRGGEEPLNGEEESEKASVLRLH
jgi:predicted ATP-grasp superfamily ATP-dependent carboligase